MKRKRWMTSVRRLSLFAVVPLSSAVWLLFIVAQSTSKEMPRDHRDFDSAVSLLVLLCVTWSIAAIYEYRLQREMQRLRKKDMPDMYCITAPDGECISTDPRCFHRRHEVEAHTIVPVGDHYECMNCPPGTRVNLDLSKYFIEESDDGNGR